MTERERPHGRAGDARPPDEGRAPEISWSNEPIAIVGMACRFPSADGLSAFWRMLEAGESGVIEGVPGSGEGRVGALFPDAAQAPACRFGAYLDELDLFDAAFFRILAGGGATARPAAADDAGDLLAGAGRRRHGPGSPQGQPHRRLCGHQQQRVSRADPGDRLPGRARRQPLFRHWHFLQHGHRPGRLRAWAGGAGPGAGYRVFVLAGGDPSGGDGPATGRGGPRACRRRARDPLREAAGDARQRRHALAGRPLRHLRRGRERVRAGRRLRHRRAQAARRGGGRRRPHLGRGAWLGAQSGRGESGSDGPERAGAGGR